MDATRLRYHGTTFIDVTTRTGPLPIVPPAMLTESLIP